ncbi:MAG TPA: hypothetical protein VFX73_01705 [Chitinophagaceae bacterium]|nr:hypothetical protein [Chitinophagaceae bacterium]
MRKFILIYIAILVVNFGFGQNTQQYYKIQPGQPIEEVLTNEVRFLHPEFKAGTVLFRNGSVGGSRLNYNFFHQELQFINGEDTLALDKGEDIRHVVIEKDTFYFREKQWIRHITSKDNVRLAEVKYLAFANVEKNGLYGQVMASTGVDAYQVTTSNVPRNIDANQILTFVMTQDFYFGDRLDNYMLANKKNIGNMFGNKCPGIEKFLESEKINYHSLSDIQKVFEFINRNFK